MKRCLLVVGFFLLLTGCRGPLSVQITETRYENRDHFKIVTPSAIYYFDKAGGGFSRLIDSDGKDWVAYHTEPYGQYPASAASAFRGIPNLVYGSDDGGAGHPGHDQCVSEQTGPAEIASQSISGKWQWRWNFYDTHAVLTVEKTDPEAAYWFLIEGPAGGRFAPDSLYWGTDSGGPRREIPNHYREPGIQGHWHWVYLGDDDVNRILFAAQVEPDSLIDHFSCLGNSDSGLASPDGMVVFGFGRSPDTRGLMTAEQSFVLGFIEGAVKNEADHESAADLIRERMSIQ